MNLQAHNQKIEEAKGKYFRLVLVLSPFADTKTKFLKQTSKSLGYPYINLSMALAGEMVDIPARKRASQILTLLNGIIRAHSEDVVFLDNIEILFLPELKVDPLKALQLISRNKTIVAGWTGEFDGGRLTYANQGHPEFRRYQGLTEQDCTILNV